MTVVQGFERGAEQRSGGREEARDEGVKGGLELDGCRLLTDQ